MKTKSLFTSVLLLLGFVLFSNNNSNEINGRKLVDPTITVPAMVNGVEGTTISINISGPVNSFVFYTYNNNTSIANTGATGNVSISVALNQATLIVYTKIVQLNPVITTLLSGVSTNINITPNGSAIIYRTISNSSVCNSSSCATINAIPRTINSTTSYAVSSIPYSYPVSFYGGNPSWNNLQPQFPADDQWSSAINLPFNFCFFGNSYSTCQIGTNGLITFKTHSAFSTCRYILANAIPNADYSNNTNLDQDTSNSIYGVYQDLNISNAPLPTNYPSINYGVIGSSPNRKFIINFHNITQFNCNSTSDLQTSQIVLYEATNIIEVYVQKRTACSAWNGGNGIIGIQNATGTLGYAPPERNTGAWSATEEAWRFTPNGIVEPMTFQWLENGNPISSELTTTVCPSSTSTYVAKATYTICGNIVDVISQPITLTVNNDPTQSPNNLDVCYDSSQIYTTDLTQNNAVILENLNPTDFQIRYYQTLTDAQQRINNLAVPANYTFTGNNTIYVGILNLDTNCHYIKTFNINILAPVLPPTGITPQNFTPGQTLADLVVAGTNIIWFDAPTGGNILPPTTLLQDNTTYYAAEVNANGCFSRNTNSTRLAITTYNVLGTTVFDTKNLLIYPNPTSSNFRITSDILIDSIEIFDVIGKKIDSIKFNEKNVSVNLSSYNSGVYFIKIYAEGSSKIYKIVKE